MIKIKPSAFQGLGIGIWFNHCIGPRSKKYLKNSMGLRDEKIRSVCWVTGHLRILSIRDSFTEGWTSQWEKHSLEEFRGLKITGGRGAKSWGGVLLSNHGEGET